MMKTRLAIRMTAVLWLLALPTVASLQEEHFEQEYSGSLPASTEKAFRIGVEEGQHIHAVVDSQHGNILIAEEEGAKELTIEAMEPVYELVIYNKGKNEERYELTVRVFTPEPEPAEDLTPEEGSRLRMYELTMNPYKFERRFSIRLMEGEVARIGIDSLRAADRLTFTRETSDGEEQCQSGFPCLIRANREGEHVFTLSKPDELILESRMTVEIVDEVGSQEQEYLKREMGDQ